MSHSRPSGYQFVAFMRPLHPSRGRGRPRTESYDKAEILLRQGLTMKQAFDELVQQSDITINGRTEFEYRSSYDQQYASFSEAMRKRKQRSANS